MRLAVVVLGCVVVLAACGGATGASTPAASGVTTAASFPTISDAAQAWCVLHLGGPGADQHQVEDTAISLGLVEGATTRDAVFEHWAGMSPQDMRLSIRSYVLACQAAYDRASAPPA